ncbi:hypothetical protein, partial [Bosea sp. TAF32]|uniref:hypothetical protein n=1 Tax=Bosea sp. TAF32 TaxID=3237482 RepID=UPI003F90EFDF
GGGPAMYTGKGLLVLRDGRTLPLTYQFGSNSDDTRAGYLFCDLSDVDPAALFYRLRVVCDDGTDLVVAVAHSSDRYLAVIGRVSAPRDPP